MKPPIEVVFYAVDEECNAWRFQTPDYLRGWIEEFKKAVPAPARGWDGIAKYWTVDDDYAQIAAEWICHFWPEAEIKWEEL